MVSDVGALDVVGRLEGRSFYRGAIHGICISAAAGRIRSDLPITTMRATGVDVVSNDRIDRESREERASGLHRRRLCEY